jgi:hypothetical protein
MEARLMMYPKSKRYYTLLDDLNAHRIQYTPQVEAELTRFERIFKRRKLYCPAPV